MKLIACHLCLRQKFLLKLEKPLERVSAIYIRGRVLHVKLPLYNMWSGRSLNVSEHFRAEWTHTQAQLAQLFSPGSCQVTYT